VQVKAVVMNHGSLTEKEHVEALKQPILINASDNDKMLSREKLAVYQSILDCKKDLRSDVKVASLLVGAFMLVQYTLLHTYPWVANLHVHLGTKSQGWGDMHASGLVLPAIGQKSRKGQGRCPTWGTSSSCRVWPLVGVCTLGMERVLPNTARV